MGRRLLFVVLVVMLLAGYGFVALEKPVPALTLQAVKLAHVEPLASTTNLTWPAQGEAAVGAANYGVLATHGAQKALPTASVAKVMTALAVLRVRPLAPGASGPTITITQSDVAIYNAYIAGDGSVAKVAAGEKITEYQALQALLLPSADNIADTLANWAFGSIGAYSAYANSLAVRLGMAHSHFGLADASGYSPQTVSTARDLVVLGMVALKNPVIAQIVSKKSATIPVAGTVQNVNWLLGQNGIDGIKTGNTNQAGGVFLFSARQAFANGHSITIIGAIMSTPTLSQALSAAAALLASAKQRFSLTTLIKSGQVISTYAVPWGGNVNVIATKSVSTVLWQGHAPKLTIMLGPLHTPASAGTPVGAISFGAKSISTTAILAHSVSKPPLHWRVRHVL